MEQNTYERLMAAALRYVSFRPRSRKELQDFLVRTLKRHHTTADACIENVMIRLEEMGYVNDTAFAAWWIRQRTAVTPKGISYIRQELSRKGIDPDVIAHHIRYASVSEHEGARMIVERKKKVWERLAQPERKKKIFGLLARRGYSAEVIRSIVDGIS